MRFRTMFWSYFCCTIDFEQLADQSYLGSNRFFMPNQNLKPDFGYLIRFLQGCHFAMYHILTWQPCKYSLDHISETIHPISKFLFAKSTYFYAESDSDSQLSISVTNFAGLPDSTYPPGNP